MTSEQFKTILSKTLTRLSSGLIDSVRAYRMIEDSAEAYNKQENEGLRAAYNSQAIIIEGYQERVDNIFKENKALQKQVKELKEDIDKCRVLCINRDWHLLEEVLTKPA